MDCSSVFVENSSDISASLGSKSFGTSMLVIVVISACVTLLQYEHAKDFESLQDCGESSAFDQDHHKNLR